MAKVSVVQMLRNRKRRKWESLGLKSTYLHLSDGTVLHCWLSAGSGSGSGSGSAVLLMHGFGADGLSGWDTDQIRALSETGAKVMVADLVFFGESRTPGQGRCERFQAATVRAAAQCAGITSVVAVGHSYGGFVAFWMAQLFPDFVGGLVLVSSAVAGAAADRDASVLASLGVPDVRELLVPPSADALARALSVTFHSPPLPWLPRFILNDMLQTLGGDPQLRREVADAIITGSDECKVLPPVRQRCLLVWGQHDRIFPLELGHLLRKHLGDATELVVMDGAGHVPQLEKPGQVTQALLKFLGTVMSSTRHMPKL